MQARWLPYFIQFPYQERESFTVGIEAQRIRASIQYVVSDGGRIAMFLAHTPATLCGGGGDYLPSWLHAAAPYHGKGVVGLMSSTVGFVLKWIRRDSVLESLL